MRSVTYSKQISRSVLIRTDSRRRSQARHNDDDSDEVGALIITRAAATGVDVAPNIVDAAARGADAPKSPPCAACSQPPAQK